MSRQKIAAGNWKMNTTVEEGILLAKNILEAPRNIGSQTILAVPFTHLYLLFDLVKSVSDVKIAAQNCHHELSGAYTGEISAHMLNKMGIEYVVIGHSERRAYNHEDHSLLALKLRAALENHLKVIFCCGEELEIRKGGTHVAHVQKQLEDSLFGLATEEMSEIIIAYEPVWAIGTGETASPAQAQEMHAAIRKMLSDQYGENIAQNTSILYGGSVKASNASELFSQADVDGGLVGGASLNADEFISIINAF